MADITLKELLDDHQTGHSDYQMDRMVVMRSGGSTPYGQYKQALRELYRRLRGYRELSCDLEKLDIDIEESNERRGVETKPNDFEGRREDVEFKRKTMQREEAVRALESCKRELIRFYQIAAGLKEAIGELTEERRAVLDAEMWASKAREIAAVDFLTQKRLTPRFFSFLSVLEYKDKVQLIQEIEQNRQGLISWYMDRHDTPLPMLSTVPQLEEIFE